MPLMSKTIFEDVSSLIDPRISADCCHEYPFDPLFPIDIRFIKFVSQKPEPNMYRHDYFKLVCIHSGAIICRLQNRSLSLRAGDLFVMGSARMHRISAISQDRVEATALYFLPSVIRGGGTGEDLEYLMPFLAQDDNFPHVVPAATGLPAQVLGLMNRIWTELLAGSSSRRHLSVKTFLKMILVLLGNHYAGLQGGKVIQSRKDRQCERLKPLFRHLEECYSKPISVEGAARQLHMSKSSFMRFFKETTGESFISYLNHFRLTKAESLLALTDLSAAEIGHRVGFTDPSYFGVMFRRFFGVTPGEYRRGLRNSHLGAVKEAARLHRSSYADTVLFPQ